MNNNFRIKIITYFRTAFEKRETLQLFIDIYGKKARTIFTDPHVGFCNLFGYQFRNRVRRV